VETKAVCCRIARHHPANTQKRATLTPFSSHFTRDATHETPPDFQTIIDPSTIPLQFKPEFALGRAVPGGNRRFQRRFRLLAQVRANGRRRGPSDRLGSSLGVCQFFRMVQGVGGDRDPLATSRRQNRAKNTRHESDAVGMLPHSPCVPPALARHRVLPPGRQATPPEVGRLSDEERPWPNFRGPPYAPGLPGVQRSDATVALWPCACVIAATSDDPQAGMPRGAAPNAESDDRLGIDRVREAGWNDRRIKVHLALA